MPGAALIDQLLHVVVRLLNRIIHDLLLGIGQAQLLQLLLLRQLRRLRLDHGEVLHRMARSEQLLLPARRIFVVGGGDHLLSHPSVGAPAGRLKNPLFLTEGLALVCGLSECANARVRLQRLLFDACLQGMETLGLLTRLI